MTRDHTGFPLCDEQGEALRPHECVKLGWVGHLERGGDVHLVNPCGGFTPPLKTLKTGPANHFADSSIQTDGSPRRFERSPGEKALQRVSTKDGGRLRQSLTRSQRNGLARRTRPSPLRCPCRLSRHFLPRPCDMSEARRDAEVRVFFADRRAQGDRPTLRSITPNQADDQAQRTWPRTTQHS
jgi:hypothetical protein